MTVMGTACSFVRYRIYFKMPSDIQKSTVIRDWGCCRAKVKSRGKSGAYQKSADRGGARRDREKRLRVGLGSRHRRCGGLFARRDLLDIFGQRGVPPCAP